MQMIAGYKSTWSREGTRRYVDALNPSPQQEERANKREIDLYEATPKHESDKVSIVGDDRLADERYWITRIGSAIYQKYGKADAGGTLVSETAWLSRLVRGLSFPGADFGSFPNTNLQGGPPKVSPGTVVFKGEDTKNGIPSYHFTWTGALSSMVNATWE